MTFRDLDNRALLLAFAAYAEAHGQPIDGKLVEAFIEEKSPARMLERGYNG